MKKTKQFLILFTVLFCQTIFAQTAKKDSSKWTISVDFSINQNFRTFVPGNITQDSIDEPKIALGFSVKPYYRISKKINVYSGISLSDKGYKTRKYVQSTEYISGGLGPQGQLPPTYIVGVALQQYFDYYYLSVPVGIDYKIFSGNFYITVGVGLNLDICLFTNVENIIYSGGQFASYFPQYYDGGHIYPESPSLSGSLNSKFCFQIENNTTIFLQPFYTRSLSNIDFRYNSDAGSNPYLYTYGVSLGMLFK